MNDWDKHALRETVRSYLDSQSNLADCYTEISRLQTIPEVQAYIGAKERLSKAQDLMDSARHELADSVTGIVIVNLGDRGTFAVDRYDIAKIQEVI